MAEEKGLEALSARNEMVEVIRRAVFPGSTGPEMALYVQKCKESGINPLSKRIIPVKFANKDGTSNISFIVTIDQLRTMSEQTGEYDGMDEPEYSEYFEMEYEEYDEATKRYAPVTMEVPGICRVRIYRKGITRPFVGVARWKEYYPGQKKGRQWRQMPSVMLAKVAEAAARRIAFPQRLANLYDSAEMDQAVEQIAPAATTGKPAISMPKSLQVPAPAAPVVDSGEVPDAETRSKNFWINENQEKRLYAIIKQSGVPVDYVKSYLQATKGSPHFYYVSWKKSGNAKSDYDRLCETLEKQPKYFDRYAPVTTAEPVAEEIPLPEEPAEEVAQ
jgi:phage recombination protein Bet